MKTPALLAPVFLLAASTGVLLAQPPLPGLVFKGQRVTVTAAPATPDGVMPAGPAQVCLAPSGMCFTAPDNGTPFGFSPDATPVQLGANQQGLLFTAIASSSGSGSEKLIAVLEVRNGRLDNLAPGVKVSEQGEYKMWQEPSISKTALLVTADYVWGRAETHFSAHRFRISTYVLEPIVASDVQFYSLRDEFITSKRYPSLDEVVTVAVLGHEKVEVLARLHRQK